MTNAVKAFLNDQNLEQIRTIAQVYKALPDEQKEPLAPIAESFSTILEQAIVLGIIDHADAEQISAAFTGNDNDTVNPGTGGHNANTQACIKNMRPLESAMEMFLMETEDLPDMITLDHLRVYLQNMELPECPCSCTSESYSIASDLERGLYIKCECHGSICNPIDVVSGN